MYNRTPLDSSETRKGNHFDEVVLKNIIYFNTVLCFRDNMYG